MNLLPCVLGAVAVCLNLAAQAQSMERWGYPDPDAFAKATYALCEEQHMSIMLAARYRDLGKSRDQVLSLIPENPPSLRLRAIDVYRENVEDVFAFPNVSTYALMAFRSEVCRREVQSAITLPRFAGARERVLSCQDQHGSGKSNDLYLCIRKIVNSM